MRSTNGILGAFLLLGFTTTAFAQQDAASARPVDDCYTTLKTGSGVHYTKICISSTGNITSYESPAGVEHLRILDPLEGYRVCRGDGWSDMWDTGIDGAGEVSIHQPNGRNTLPLRITTLGFNGLQVSQEFLFRAVPYGPAELTIRMKVTNRGTQTIGDVWIARFFDADINGDIDDDRAYATANTVAVTDPNGTARGLSLTAGILDKPHWTGALDYSSLRLDSEYSDAGCGFGTDSVRTEQGPADLAGNVAYSVGDVLPGRTKTVAFVYRRF